MMKKLDGGFSRIFYLFISPCRAHSQEVISDTLKHVYREGVPLNDIVVRGNTDKQIQMSSALKPVRANKQFIITAL